MSFLEGGFSSFLISLDKINCKRVTIALLLGPIGIYISDYFRDIIIKSSLKGGVGI